MHSAGTLYPFSSLTSIIASSVLVPKCVSLLLCSPSTFLDACMVMLIPYTAGTVKDVLSFICAPSPFKLLIRESVLSILPPFETSIISVTSCFVPSIFTVLVYGNVLDADLSFRLIFGAVLWSKCHATVIGVFVSVRSMVFASIFGLSVTLFSK